MKLAKYFFFFNLLLITLTFTSCARSSDAVWDDTRTASRHVGRGMRSLGGKHTDSRQVYSPNEFYDIGANGELIPRNGNVGEDFIPLQDNENGDEIAMADSITMQPRENPGDPGSSIPGIDSFKDPSSIPGLSGLFQNIRFEYNSNLIKGQDNLSTLRSIANYLQTHPSTYVFVEGHTDERGAEAYNLALGSRRANAVRNALLADGVNPNNVFTISFGKERPAVMENNEEAWSQNRRAEFKIYQR